MPVGSSEWRGAVGRARGHRDPALELQKVADGGTVRGSVRRPDGRAFRTELGAYGGVANYVSRVG